MPTRPSLPPTRILLTRHGQTESNRDGLFCGHSETSLTALGEAQARALGARLQAVEIAAVYTSDLSRAMATAGIALHGRAVPHHVDAGLRELHYGEWEMQREREIRQRNPELYRLMEREDPAWRPPGGEDMLAVRHRTYAALMRIAQAHGHATVLIVTHGTAINCLVAEVLAMAPSHTFRVDVANCAVSEIELRKGRPVVTLLNDRSHLATLMAKPPR